MSENSSTKSLALLVSHDTITFLTKTNQHDELFYSEPIVIAMKDLNQSVAYEEIEGMIKNHLPLLLYYNQIIVCYQSTPVVIVPQAYLDERSETNYIQKWPQDQLVCPLSKIDASIAFNNFGHLYKVFQNLPNFTNAIYTHTAKKFLDRIKYDREKIQVFAQLINQKLELCIYNKGIFTLYNIYDIIGDDDIVYHILNTMQQLQLDPSQVEVSLDGNISADHPIYEHLPKYVHSVSSNEDIQEKGPKYLLYKIFECE